MKINGAVVLVTGANRGLGKSLVAASLAAKARRVYAAARDPRQLEQIVAQSPDRVIPIALDVTDAGSIEAAAARAQDVNVLINNAGVLASHGVLSSTPAQVARDFAVNFYGPLATTRAFLPALERNRAAALVNVLSVVSFASMPGLGGYAAAKAAAFSMTQALRGDLAKKGVAVHAVFPGPIDTDMLRAVEMTKTSPDEVAKAILQGIEQDLEEILPDPASRQMFDVWKRDPKAFERQMAAM